MNLLNNIALGMSSDRAIYEAKWGKLKKTKKVSPHANFDYIDLGLTQDDLP